MAKDILFYTEDHFNLFRKLTGRKMIETAMQNYEDTVRNLNRLKIAGDDHGRKINQKKYDELLSSAKADLNEKVVRGLKLRDN